jgi:hypothetical protein
MCTVAEVAPTTNPARQSHKTLRALAVNISAMDATATSVEISARRSYLSPSGTKTSIPVAMPAKKFLLKKLTICLPDRTTLPRAYHM